MLAAMHFKKVLLSTEWFKAHLKVMFLRTFQQIRVQLWFITMA